MLTPTTLSSLFVATVVVGVLAAVVYARYADDRSPVGLTSRRRIVASALAISVAVVLVVGGDPSPLDRRTAAVLASWTLLLVAGANGLAAAVEAARRWRAFHPESAVPTGEVSPGPTAVSGTATDESVVSAPVTGREACCYAWDVEFEDPYAGAETGDYREVAAEQGGTTFALDDGSGSVRVDPAGARLDLGGRQTVDLPAGEDLPRPHTDAISDVAFDHGDSARRYTEWVAAPGDTLSVAGEVRRRDGRLWFTDTVVTTGSLTATAEVYRARTLLYALAGFGGVVVALWGLFATV